MVQPYIFDFCTCRTVHVDLTSDEQETEGEMVQSILAESALHCSPDAPPYSPLAPQNEPVVYS